MVRLEEWRLESEMGGSNSSSSSSCGTSNRAGDITRHCAPLLTSGAGTSAGMGLLLQAGLAAAGGETPEGERGAAAAAAEPCAASSSGIGESQPSSSGETKATSSGSDGTSGGKRDASGYSAVASPACSPCLLAGAAAAGVEGVGVDGSGVDACPNPQPASPAGSSPCASGSGGCSSGVGGTRGASPAQVPVPPAASGTTAPSRARGAATGCLPCGSGAAVRPPPVVVYCDDATIAAGLCGTRGS